MSAHPGMAMEAGSAKRRQILEGARSVFAAEGYERASVDQIAARAGVSKATVYNHFRDKKALFIAAVVESCDRFREELAGKVADPSGDVQTVLREIGTHVMTASLAPAAVSLYRHAIAEAERMPEIGRLVYERGTLALQELVAAHLRRWDAEGALRIEDPRSAAVAFVALCQGDLVIRTRLGVLEHPVEGQIRTTVERAVSIFVRAHRA